jgi:thymidylate synthase
MSIVNEMYQKAGQNILEDGFLVETRGTRSKEVIASRMFFDLNDPLVVTLGSRKLKPSYVIDEFNWYMSKSLKAAGISKSAPFWDTLKDGSGNVISNYGYWIFAEHEGLSNGSSSELISRFDNCVNLLAADPQSRKAIINIHGVDNSGLNPKDTPCTLSLQFLIRNDELHMIVNMRSNDLVVGWCNDILQFQFIAWMMYAVLKFRRGMNNLKLGDYYHNAGSLHIYEKHWNKDEFNPHANSVFQEESRDAFSFKNHLFVFVSGLTRYNIVPPSRATELTNYEWLVRFFAPSIGQWYKASEAAEEKDENLLQIPLDEGF